MSLSKSAILEADDLPREEVQVPEWGGSVFIRTLTGTERDHFEASVIGSQRSGRLSLQNIRARLAVLCITNGDGTRLFADAEAVALGKKNAAALNRIFEAAQRLNGLTNEDVEELAKNFEPTPDDSSTSG